jgi:hypothetical protein
MRALWAAVVVVLTAATSSAEAQEALTLTVRPSHSDALSAAARERQARLERRMREAEYLFRNICIHCGGGIDRPGAHAPFNPIEALASPRR